MERSNSSGDYSGVRIDVGLAFHKTIDYDRKAMRGALARGAAIVRKEARRAVSRRAISAPGEDPGMDSGDLRRGIGVVSRGGKGGWVKIGVRKLKSMSAFYPAFLYYGSKGHGRIQRLEPGLGIGKSNRRRRGERAALIEERRQNGQYVVAPRSNYIANALNAKRNEIRSMIQSALRDSLVPR